MEQQRDISGLTLTSGVGSAESRTACVMSAVAYVAGEPWSDHPACACRVITRYAIRVNDALWWTDDAERTAVLGPLVAMIVGTRSTHEIETQRRHIAVDSAARVAVPLALESAATRATPEHAAILRDRAATLRALAPITDEATQRAANAPLRAAADAAAAAHAYAAYDAAYSGVGGVGSSGGGNADADAAVDAADAYVYAYAASRQGARRAVRDSAIETLRLMCESS